MQLFVVAFDPELFYDTLYLLHGSALLGSDVKQWRMHFTQFP